MSSSSIQDSHRPIYEHIARACMGFEELVEGWRVLIDTAFLTNDNEDQVPRAMVRCFTRTAMWSQLNGPLKGLIPWMFAEDSARETLQDLRKLTDKFACVRNFLAHAQLEPRNFEDPPNKLFFIARGLSENDAWDGIWSVESKDRAQLDQPMVADLICAQEILAERVTGFAQELHLPAQGEPLMRPEPKADGGNWMESPCREEVEKALRQFKEARNGAG